jgi:hypothetical protein
VRQVGRSAIVILPAETLTHKNSTGRDSSAARILNHLHAHNQDPLYRVPTVNDVLRLPEATTPPISASSLTRPSGH